MKSAKSAHAVFSRHAQPRRFRNVFERPVAAIPVQPVAAIRGLTDVKIVVAIVVYIPDRNSVVSVDVDPDAPSSTVRQ